MRAIWKGAVSFGLVSIGVKLFSATEEKDIRFHQVHRSDGGRIKYKRTCSVCGEEVAYDDIAKGYDLGGGEMVILTDEIRLPRRAAGDRRPPVRAGGAGYPILYNKAYYLEPDGVGAKPYVLLRRACRATPVAIVKVAPRQREQLAAAGPGGVFVLNTMLWPDEIPRPSSTMTSGPPQEPAWPSLSIRWRGLQAEEYTDDYRRAAAGIDAKVAARIVACRRWRRRPSAIDPAALRASVERVRPGRRAAPSGGPAPHPAPASRPRAGPPRRRRWRRRAVKSKKAKAGPQVGPSRPLRRPPPRRPRPPRRRQKRPPAKRPADRLAAALGRRSGPGLIKYEIM
jgi:DNA end-binding protein Ku